MQEDPQDYERFRALAAELLRAHRDNDPTAFSRASLSAEGKIMELLISMSAVANKALDTVLDHDAADRYVRRAARSLPAPQSAEEVTADVWRDAIAAVEAVTREDEAGAKALLDNTENLTVFFGYFIQLAADIFINADPQLIAEVTAAARQDGPPPIG